MYRLYIVAQTTAAEYIFHYPDLVNSFCEIWLSDMYTGHKFYPCELSKLTETKVVIKSSIHKDQGAQILLGSAAHLLYITVTVFTEMCFGNLYLFQKSKVIEVAIVNLDGPFTPAFFFQLFSQLFSQLFRFKNGLCTQFCNFSTNTYMDKSQ